MTKEYSNNGKKRICLVTGGGRGIGAAIAQQLAQEGYRVVINYYHSEEPSRQLADGLINNGCEVLTVQANISQKEQVEAMFAFIKETWGVVDCLINNAGVSLYKMLIDTEEAEWQHIMDTNLKSVYLCSKYALPSMIAQRWGRIINISSVWGLTGASCESIYAASKGGMIALSKSLAAEYGAFGINVNAIAPGAIATDMLSNDLNTQEIHNLIDEIPAGRLGKADDIAAACVFFLSSGADYINGQVIAVDGGWKRGL